MAGSVATITSSRSSSFARITLTGAAIVALVAAAYHNSLGGAFVLDDQSNVVENPSLRQLWPLRDVLWPPAQAGVAGRPLANLSFALNYAAHGLDPRGYHLVNVTLHALAALVLFGLVRRTLLLPALRDRFGAAALPLATVIATLWGAHPLATAAVDYVSQRTEQLMALFYLLTLYAFVRAIEAGTARWLALAVAVCACGMASKETMITAPVMVVLFDRAFVAGTFRGVWRERRGFYAALASTWLLLAGLMATSQLAERGVGLGGVSPAIYALSECHAVLLYLKLALWPAPLVFDYGWSFAADPLTGAAEAAVVTTLLALAIWMIVRRPAVGFAAAWFLLILAPTSSIVPVVHQPIAESRMYLPLAGIVATAALALHRLAPRRAWLLTAALVPCFALTHARHAVYREPLTLWTDTLEKRPDNARAHNNLAALYIRLKRPADALAHARAALRLRPNYVNARINTGAALTLDDRPAEALSFFTSAIELDPTNAAAHANLGNTFMMLGRPAEARAPLEAALRLDPHLAQPHNDLGVLLLDAGDIAGALEHELTAIRLAPDMANAHYNLGNVFARQQRLPEAIAAFDQAIALNPNLAKAHNNRGVALLFSGRAAEAVASFEAALRLNPGDARTQTNLAAARRAVEGGGR